MKSHRGENSQYIFSVILAAMGAKFVNLPTHAETFRGPGNGSETSSVLILLPTSHRKSIQSEN